VKESLSDVYVKMIEVAEFEQYELSAGKKDALTFAVNKVDSYPPIQI